ncbi:MAG TPA: methylmalonyl-CoA decarboxylase [Thermodesulfobacteriota bacterium]|nr:methylmalonyl-CoA decarboxylase [Thermodesulfobacteriota bacterium]
MFIITDLTESIGTITLNNPAKRNALSKALIEELITALQDFSKASVRVVVIRAGSDAKVWSSGHDVSELRLLEHDPLQYSDPVERAIRAVKTSPAPIIAMVHGSVWAGATNLVLSCDIVIGDETSSFAVTPANLGLPYNSTSLAQFIKRVPLNFAKEMFFTAALVKAADAARWGILNHLVPADKLEEFTYDMAHLIATKAPLAVSVIKEQLRILADAAFLRPEIFERIQELRQIVFNSEDYREGIRAFYEKRKPVFTGK